MTTYKEIAQCAGVSIATVSRMLNDSGYVSEEAQQRIHCAISQLKYVSPRVPEALLRQNIREIAFYTEDLVNPYYIMTYQGMVEQARVNGYRVVLCGKPDFENIGQFAQGVIFSNEYLARYYLEKWDNPYHVPIVCMHTGSSFRLERSVPCVTADMTEVQEKAIAYLLKKGKRSIIYATPIPASENIRTQAYLHSMRDYALPSRILSLSGDEVALLSSSVQNTYAEASYLALGVDAFTAGQKIARRYAGEIARLPGPRAILCYNDELALGLYRELRRMGYRIPGDFGLLGIDGSSAVKYIDCRLSTVDLFPGRQGKKCVELLHAILHREKYHYRNRIAVKIREGDTV
ncbi:MAG: LacI family DNA-binding transcriptional regulator [Eubacteriales bacterium]|nr:LacI family DNA-binding transcriptional regulator [Eubacteriales bacterium]